MPILIMFLLAPLGAGAALEYALCRFPRKRFWRYIPPAVGAVIVTAVALFRYHGWSDTGGAPLETLLFFPGLPALGLFLGLFLGWRIWKHLWRPKVFREKKKG